MMSSVQNPETWKQIDRRERPLQSLHPDNFYTGIYSQLLSCMSQMCLVTSKGGQLRNCGHLLFPLPIVDHVDVLLIALSVVVR
jgi:hypothetical protein